jgi:hypothetical protein
MGAITAAIQEDGELADGASEQVGGVPPGLLWMLLCACNVPKWSFSRGLFSCSGLQSCFCHKGNTLPEKGLKGY